MKQESQQTHPQRRVRVLHVISGLDPRGGGPAAGLAGLAPALQRAGADVRVLATHRAGDDFSLVEHMRDLGVDVVTVGPCTGPLTRHPQLSAKTGEIVANADVVHVHALWEEIQHQTMCAARRHGVPYVVTPHGMLDPWSLRQSRWKKRMYLAWRLRRDLSHAAALHFTTAMEHEQVAPLRIGPPAIVEPNGIDLREYDNVHPAGTLRRQLLGSGGRGTIISFLGRIHPGKGVEYLIPALSRLSRSDVHLLVIGPDSGGFRAKMEKLAAQRGVADRVHFTGLLRGAEKISAIADSDLFCLPSEHENFGIAVVEALATGVPVIISDHVALREDVLAGGVGAVVPLQVEALAFELDRWTTDMALRGAAAAQTRAFARARYDWDAIARHWVRHYTLLAD